MYAWKPSLIQEAMETYGNHILFLDLGVELRQNLSRVQHIIQTHGFFSSLQPNQVGKRTFSETFTSMGTTKDLVEELPFCTAGLVGFSANMEYTDPCESMGDVCASSGMHQPHWCFSLDAQFRSKLPEYFALAARFCVRA
jgi:hypothetical protein